MTPKQTDEPISVGISGRSLNLALILLLLGMVFNFGYSKAVLEQRIAHLEEDQQDRIDLWSEKIKTLDERIRILNSLIEQRESKETLSLKLQAIDSILTAHTKKLEEIDNKVDLLMSGKNKSKTSNGGVWPTTSGTITLESLYVKNRDGG